MALATFRGAFNPNNRAFEVAAVITKNKIQVNIKGKTTVRLTALKENASFPDLRVNIRKTAFVMWARHTRHCFMQTFSGPISNLGNCNHTLNIYHSRFLIRAILLCKHQPDCPREVRMRTNILLGRLCILANSRST